MGLVDEAFNQIKRENFLPEDMKHLSEIDAPIPIGYQQTNSQPSTVKQMLKWLDVKKGQKVLDIGSGSGWTSALLSYLVGPKGKILATERIPELRDFGEANCTSLGIKNTTFFLAGKELGLSEFGPFDRILVSASAKKLPQKLLNQLKIGGKIVIPVNNDILEITKILKKEYITTEHPGFTFVPLITSNA